jgi:outer membrane protein TolC
LAACGAIQPKLATDPNALAPPTATKSWAPEEATRIPGGKATLDAFSGRSRPPPAAIQPGRVYDLPNLIDLAQQTNPETRVAWQATRAAAARLGIAEGAYLPTLGAIGMASYAHLPDYDKMGPFLVRTGVLEPLLRLDWLLLDFGRRTADLDNAAQTLLAANLQFNRKQQSVIFAVQKAYFSFDASRARVTARETALKAATVVEQATGIRSRSGLASVTMRSLRARWYCSSNLTSRARNVTSTRPRRSLRRRSASRQLPCRRLRRFLPCRCRNSCRHRWIHCYSRPSPPARTSPRSLRM